MVTVQLLEDPEVEGIRAKQEQPVQPGMGMPAEIQTLINQEPVVVEPAQ